MNRTGVLQFYNGRTMEQAVNDAVAAYVGAVGRQPQVVAFGPNDMMVAFRGAWPVLVGFTEWVTVEALDWWACWVGELSREEVKGDPACPQAPHFAAGYWAGLEQEAGVWIEGTSHA